MKVTRQAERGGPARGAALVLALLLLAACSGTGETVYPDDQNRKRAGGGTSYSDTSQGIFGKDGLSFLGGESAPAVDPGGGGIGVNSFLWRASLDTISFMPLVSADPFGGVIITDWYSPAETPGERFKVNLYILGRDLRADGVRAAVFRQRLNGSIWIDSEVEPKTSVDLENAILTRARQLRIAGLE